MILKIVAPDRGRKRVGSTLPLSPSFPFSPSSCSPIFNANFFYPVFNIHTKLPKAWLASRPVTHFLYCEGDDETSEISPSRKINDLPLSDYPLVLNREFSPSSGASQRRIIAHKICNHHGAMSRNLKLRERYDFKNGPN